MKIKSTLGFVYTPDFKEVLLIKKQKPEHHKNKYNGLGGKHETGETSLECIGREVEEESSLIIPKKEWLKIGELIWEDWHVDVFAAIYSGKKTDLHSDDEDSVGWFRVDEMPENVLTNLPWLIPLGVDCLTNKVPPFVRISY